MFPVTGTLGINRHGFIRSYVRNCAGKRWCVFYSDYFPCCLLQWKWPNHSNKQTWFGYSNCITASNMLLGPIISIIFVVTLVCAVASILTYTNPSTWNKQCHSWPSFTPVSDVFCRLIILSYLCPHESQISMYSNPGVVDVSSRSPIKGYLDLKLSWLYFFHKPYTEDNLGFYSV